MDVEPRMWLALAMLAGAAVSDLRTRRVPNPYWWPFVASAAVLTLGDLAAGDSWTLAVYAIAALLVALFYVLFRLRVFFGGADAKALMVLAFLVPAATSGVPTTLAALVTGSVAIMLLPLAYALWNLAQGNIVPRAMFMGRKIAIPAARRLKAWPMQDIDADGKAHWRYMRLIGSDADAALDRLAAAGFTHVWVTPKLPYLAFVAVGLAAVAFADPLGPLLALLGTAS